MESIENYRKKIDALFFYAQNFARKNENAGRGTQYPTFRQAASRMKCTYDELQQLIDDYQGEGYMGVAVGMQVGGFGGPMGRYKTRGEYLVEAYE